MAEIDWDKVLPLGYDDYLAEQQRDQDLEHIKPLVAALQQILDWSMLDGPSYDTKWGNTPRGHFTPREVAYAGLRDLGVLPEVPERKV